MISLPDNVAPLTERGWSFVHQDGDRYSAFPTSREPGEPFLVVRLRPDLDWTEDEEDEDPSAFLVDEAIDYLVAAYEVVP